MIEKYIKYFDYYQTHVYLTFNKDIDYQTKFGALLSILTFIILAIFTIILFIELVQKKNFSIISATSIRSDVNYDFSDFPFIFTLTNAEDEVFLDDTIFNIELINYGVEVYIDEDGNKNFRIIKQKLETVKCETLEGNKTYFKNKFNDFYSLSYYLCIKPGQNVSLYGNLGDLINGFKGMRFFINKCNNDTLKLKHANYTCKSNEIINKKFDELSFVFYFLGYNIDHFSTNGSHLYFQENSKAVAVSEKYQKINTFYFSTGTYITDTSFINNNKEKKDFYEFSGYKFDLDSSNYAVDNLFDIKDSLSVISFFLDEKVIQYYRKYDKFQSMLATLGGIYNILIIVMRFINKYFSSKILNHEIVQKITASYNLKDVKTLNGNYFDNRKKIHLSNSTPLSVKGKSCPIIYNDKKIQPSMDLYIHENSSDNLNKSFDCNFGKISVPFYYLNVSSKKQVLNNCINEIKKNMWQYYFCPDFHRKNNKHFNFFNSLINDLFEMISIEKLFQLVVKLENKANKKQNQIERNSNSVQLMKIVNLK